MCVPSIQSPDTLCICNGPSECNFAVPFLTLPDFITCVKPSNSSESCCLHVCCCSTRTRACTKTHHRYSVCLLPSCLPSLLPAGSRPATHVHPEVAEVMLEVGVDLSEAAPQKLTPELAATCNVLVTMGCGEACPFIPGVKLIEWQIPDPHGQVCTGNTSMSAGLGSRSIIHTL